MKDDIITYGGSQRGRSHIKNEKPCQDSSYIGVLNDNPEVVLLIVADGVGSSLHSEEGSSIAVKVVKEHLENIKLPITADNIKDSYILAFDAIKNHSSKNSGNIADYDTTLTTAVFDTNDGSITYGHSGDGAIIAIRKDGINESITSPQKGMEVNSVMPLRDVNSWVFGKSPGPYVSVMAVTDGILDILMPGLLKMTSEPIYVRLTSWLADLKFFDKSKPLNDQLEQRFNYIRSDIHSGITNDDLSFVCAINPNEEAAYCSDDYYKEPDWNFLKEEWRKKAYPSLYPEDSGESIRIIKQHIEAKEYAKAKALLDGVVTSEKPEYYYGYALYFASCRKYKRAYKMMVKSADMGYALAKEYLSYENYEKMRFFDYHRLMVMIEGHNAEACFDMAKYHDSKSDYKKAGYYYKKTSEFGLEKGKSQLDRPEIMSALNKDDPSKRKRDRSKRKTDRSKRKKKH